MHQIFLGCAKSIICALVGSLPKRELPLAEQRLKNIKTPRVLCGKPKPLSELSYWKARDFKFFLFHYGSFCLNESVNENLYRSFNQLSVSLRLLSMTVCSETHIREAEKLLDDFLSSFVELYGKDSQSFNFHSLRHINQQVRRKGPIWRNSAFAFESANHFLLNSVSGTKKTLSHLVDNFFLRQQRVSRVTGHKKCDERFTLATEYCKSFALMECGPGNICSRHFFSTKSQRLSSLSYTRLGENWSECITTIKSGKFVVLVAFYRDTFDSVFAIAQKYCSRAVKSRVQTTVALYYEIGDLQDSYSVINEEDILVGRVVVLSGTLERCFVSVVAEGFDHN